VPILGCDCPVCRSSDPRDQRLRTAALLRREGLCVAIDSGPDFRQQMLRAGVERLDAILMTHEHNDHIIGLDDVRPYNFRQGGDMPVYALPRVQEELRTRFNYIFKTGTERYPGAPQVSLHDLDKDQTLRIGGVEIIPVEVMHGKMPILGFRIGDVAYLTDVKSIEAAEMDKLKGLDTLVMSALHHSSHHSHLNLEEALRLAAVIGARQTWLIHLSHRMGLYAEVDANLPEGINLGYDGLVIEFPT
jgi:phosphoribosyl 1,2-cyclic phosphate phosphodiesterase